MWYACIWVCVCVCVFNLCVMIISFVNIVFCSVMHAQGFRPNQDVPEGDVDDACLLRDQDDVQRVLNMNDSD